MPQQFDSQRWQLSGEMFVAIGASGAEVVVTREKDGRTTSRIVLTINEAVNLRGWLESLTNSQRKTVAESQKKLR